MSPDEILQFWLGAPAADYDSFRRKLNRWFGVDKALDAEMRARFGEVLQRARDGAFDEWAKTPRGRLALILLFNQFTRNLHRGTPRAFENDARALALTESGLDKHDDAALSYEEKIFFYLPLGHSEDVSRQERSVALNVAAANAAPAGMEKAYALSVNWARGYLEEIRRFGRFPRRNATLGRTCTQEEMAFLNPPAPKSS